MLDAFAKRVQASGDRIAIRHKRQGVWQSVTWQSLDQLSSNLAQELSTMGIARGSLVAHHSENRLAWLVTDLAIQKLSAIHLPLHGTFTPPQAMHLLQHAGADILLVSPTLDAAWQTQSHSPTRLIVGEDCEVTYSQKTSLQSEAKTEAELPSGTSLLLYTSGTSGKPRGVCLSNSGLAANAIATQQAFAIGQPSDAGENRVRLNVLPLSHVYALVCDFYGSIIDGAQLAIPPSRQTWLQDAAEIQPTFLNAVPYFYERLQAEVLQASESANLALQKAALQKLTGGKLIHCCVGGATASPALLQFFEACELPLLAGYGLTENSPCISVSGPHVYRAGSVGKIVPGLEARVSSEHEILVRGTSVMCGYYKDTYATAAALKEGWLHTGDLGHFDEDGFLFLQGRKTEMLVTSLGKNIWPGNLEQRILRDSLFQQVVVVGDARPYLTALVMLAAEQRIHESEVLKKIELQLSELPSHEQVRKVAILSMPLESSRGELTAKGELCRSVIAQNYGAQIEKLYAP